MNAFTLRRNYATSLLTDVKAAPVGMPRREVLLDWLKEFIATSESDEREPVPVSTDNLRAINKHLLAFSATTSTRPALD